MTLKEHGSVTSVDTIRASDLLLQTPPQKVSLLEHLCLQIKHTLQAVTLQRKRTKSNKSNKSLDVHGILNDHSGLGDLGVHFQLLIDDFKIGVFANCALTLSWNVRENGQDRTD